MWREGAYRIFLIIILKQLQFSATAHGGICYLKGFHLPKKCYLVNIILYGKSRVILKPVFFRDTLIKVLNIISKNRSTRLLGYILTTYKSFINKCPRQVSDHALNKKEKPRAV